MKKRAFWIVAVLLVAAAVAVRLLYQSPEDAHERLHAEEARAQAEIEALASLPPEQQLPRLKQYLAPDAQVAVRTAAVDAVVRIDAPEARALLRDALRDYASPVRVRVAEMANRLPREEAAALLIDCLLDHDTLVRQTAITHLQAMRERRAVATLVELLRNDPNDQTQHMAMGALRAITRQPFYARYTDPSEKRARARQQWLEWWTKAQSQYPSRESQPLYPQRTIPAPDLTLRTIDGETISLRNRPKPLLINFWGTWCGECQHELPALIRLHEKYGDQVQVVGVAFDEPEGEQGLRKFCAEKGVRYPQVMGDQRIADAFHLHGVPQTVLIDTQGDICFWWVGERDFGTLERALQAVMAKGSPLPADTARE
ncbi:MAG: redoxin domain-containing protein [Fimbriimonadales bacterium]|nr:redoxin domain-containing protein [Fimbriimonadales bacterium]